MNLLRFAGAMLLALTLASLTALGADPAAPGNSQQAQPLAHTSQGAEARADTLLAMANAPTHRMARPGIDLGRASVIVPTAGEFIPGAGQ